MKALWKQVNTLPRKGWLTLVLLVLTAVLYSEFSLALSGWNGVTWGGSLPLFLLNLLPVLLVLLVLWLATGQAWLAVLATGVLHFLLTGGNYYKLQFRDSPMEWADLYRIREGFGMAGQYNVTFTPVMWGWIAAIVLLVAIVFRSLTVPVILVACIELAIFINEGVPYWTGEVVPFIANTFIGCIQLGATVDYSILLATRYREELQNGHDRKEAMVIAAASSDHSIITGALVLFCATFSVAMVSHIDLVACLCKMLCRGTLISAAVCLFLVPSILVICEPLIARTTLGWRRPYQPRKKRTAALAAAEGPAPDEPGEADVPALVAGGDKTHSE